jgi:hypothetical protein
VRSRPGSKMRCNSTCGHGRHANFWSRVSGRQAGLLGASSGCFVWGVWDLHAWQASEAFGCIGPQALARCWPCGAV